LFHFHVVIACVGTYQESLVMRIFLLAALAIPALANAQATPDITLSMNAPGNYSTFVVLPNVPDIWRESPKLRQQKLDAALALKAEAAALREADGGTFTRQHEAYIRRKARTILSWSE
jgi:hypothetical protein